MYFDGSRSGQFLLKIGDQCGGHLASNLGVVELTLALHCVLNSPADKIVWDVSHQCYVHKLWRIGYGKSRVGLY